MQECAPMYRSLENLPSWVPESAQHYLAHTEAGAPIRALARKAGRHASTISRQVRMCEMRRDDLLVDEALRRLSLQVQSKRNTGSKSKENRMIANCLPEKCEPQVTEEKLEKEASRVLRRLCETGAVLAVAPNMEKAVVVRDKEPGASSTSTVLDRKFAEAMALNKWIVCDRPGKVTRYRITSAGRETLNRLIAKNENSALGFSEFSPSCEQGGAFDREGEERGNKRIRYGVVETPLTLLARRKGRDGKRFLSEDLVRAGERLREDFELAQMERREAQNWDQFLTSAEHGYSGDICAVGPEAARARIISALRDLGPGLGDVALRCCCYLEGLEKAEKRMGWSARFGKIVLRIALQRLKRHYDILGENAGLIG